MDWIEQLLGVSPDGGNGTLEFVYYLVLVFGLVAGVRWRVLRRRNRREGPSGDQGA